MSLFLLGFLSGAAALWAVHRSRTAEIRAALKAAIALGEVDRRRALEMTSALLAIQRRAEGMRRIIRLGDSVTLPPTAKKENP